MKLAYLLQQDTSLKNTLLLIIVASGMDEPLPYLTILICHFSTARESYLWVTEESMGGALAALFTSTIMFTGSTLVNFTNNFARDDGGPVYSNNDQVIINDAIGNVHPSTKTVISFDGNSLVRFSDNRAIVGGEICGTLNSSILFKGNVMVIIDNDHSSS